MLRRVKYIVSLLCLVLAATSCDKTIHEYPTDCSIVLNLSCEIDAADPEFFVTVECDAKNGTSYIVRTMDAAQKNTRFDEPVKLRYIYDLYRVVASHIEFVERRVAWADPTQPTPDPVRFEIAAAEYKVLVWCDYVRASEQEKSWYYNTDDLRNIRYSDIEVKDNNDKDVFTKMVHLNYRDYSYAVGTYEFDEHLVLERPSGRYKCYTTDVKDYLGKDSVKEITTVFSYVQWVADGYNVEDQKPNHFAETRTFLSTVSVDDLDSEGKLQMGYDFVFVNGKQTNVKINFEFYKGVVVRGADGKLYKPNGALVTEDDKISNWTGVVVPLKRNMETVVEGRFLTQSFGSGGIGIEPGFEGEIVIPWE